MDVNKSAKTVKRTVTNVNEITNKISEAKRKTGASIGNGVISLVKGVANVGESI